MQYFDHHLNNAVDEIERLTIYYSKEFQENKILEVMEALERCVNDLRGVEDDGAADEQQKIEALRVQIDLFSELSEEERGLREKESLDSGLGMVREFHDYVCYKTNLSTHTMYDPNSVERFEAAESPMTIPKVRAIPHMLTDFASSNILPTNVEEPSILKTKDAEKIQSLMLNDKNGAESLSDTKSTASPREEAAEELEQSVNEVGLQEAAREEADKPASQKSSMGEEVQRAVGATPERFPEQLRTELDELKQNVETQLKTIKEQLLQNGIAGEIEKLHQSAVESSKLAVSLGQENAVASAEVEALIDKLEDMAVQKGVAEYGVANCQKKIDYVYNEIEQFEEKQTLFNQYLSANICKKEEVTEIQELLNKQVDDFEARKASLEELIDRHREMLGDVVQNVQECNNKINFLTTHIDKWQGQDVNIIEHMNEQLDKFKRIKGQIEALEAEMASESKKQAVKLEILNNRLGTNERMLREQTAEIRKLECAVKELAQKLDDE